MSKVRQIALLEAGCQPWNGEIVATCGSRFAYCATLAIYIYELHKASGEFLLHSIMSEHKKTITSIAWHPTNADLLASTSVDAHVVVWNVSERRMIGQLIANNLPAGTQPRSISWIPHADVFGHDMSLSFLSTRGPLFIWKLDYGAGEVPGAAGDNTTSLPPSRRSSLASTASSQASSVIPPTAAVCSVHKDSQSVAQGVTRYQWHWQRPGEILFGHDDGTVSHIVPGRKPLRKVTVTNDGNEVQETDEQPMMFAGIVSISYVSGMPLPVKDTITGLEWNPLTSGSDSSQFLLVSAVSGLRLVDSASLSVLVHFRLPSSAAQVQTLAWIPGAPGMFLTGDSDIGLLRIFTVATTAPIETIRIKQNGFRALKIFQSSLSFASTADKDNDEDGLSLAAGSSNGSDGSSAASRCTYTLPPGHVVCTFLDGGVGLYDLIKRNWTFLREMGHIETIFDCRFKTGDPNLLATASFDGTVKIWDIRVMKPTVSSPGNESIIYAVSWAPGDSGLLAAATSKNGLFVFDTEKGAIIKRYQEHTGCVYGVAWNSRDNNLIASASKDCTCIVRKFDGTLVRKYTHPLPVFGVDWSIHAKDLLATGCEDKQIRIFYTTTNSDKPLKIFGGHTAKVFRVQWSPLKEGLLASGSDDGTVRVWNYSSGSCTAVLNGHTAPARGLLWHWEVPYLIMSGSWDATIRVWDIRDGACVDTVLDHNADVYGLTSHPARPFLLASSSRDSTVRLWSTTRVSGGIELQLLSGSPLQNVIAGSQGDKSLELGAPPRMCGPKSSEICKDINHSKGNASSICRLISLMQSSPHVQNALNLIRVFCGTDDSMLPDDYRKGIVHSKHLLKYGGAEARNREMTHISKFGGGIMAPSREEQTRQAAQAHLKTGNLRQFCELQVKLGCWDKALAVSPGVSLAYWKELTRRYIQVLKREGRESVMEHCMAIGDTKTLVNHLTRQGQLSQAVLTGQAAVEGHIQVPPDQKENANNSPTDENKKLVHNAYRMLAEQYFCQGSPIQSACCHFAMDDVEGGLNKLIRGNELELALWIGEQFKRKDPVLDLAREWMSRRSEKFIPSDLWDCRESGIALVRPHPERGLLLAQLCARFSGDATEIDALHSKAGFSDLSKCLTEAEELAQSSGSVFDQVKLYLLSSAPERGLKLGLETIKAIMSRSGWTIKDIWDLVRLLSAVRTSKLVQQSSQDFCANLLLVSSYCATLLAIRRGYTPIVSPLFRHCKMLLDRDVQFITLPLTPALVDKEFYAWKLRLQNPDAQLPSDYAAVWQSIEHKSGPDPFPLEPGCDITAGSHLPNHSDVKVSYFTGERIQGPLFFLEDCETVISLNEALMWAKVNAFSPLGSGQRINPF